MNDEIIDTIARGIADAMNEDDDTMYLRAAYSAVQFLEAEGYLIVKEDEIAE